MLGLADTRRTLTRGRRRGGMNAEGTSTSPAVLQMFFNVLFEGHSGSPVGTWELDIMVF